MYELAVGILGKPFRKSPVAQKIRYVYDSKAFMREVKEWINSQAKQSWRQLSESTKLKESSIWVGQGNVDVDVALSTLHCKDKFSTMTYSTGARVARLMYEVQLNSNGVMQIGWCSSQCSFGIGKGCGNTPNSFSYDGQRALFWNQLPDKYGEVWKCGDFITSVLDITGQKVFFYRNGNLLGPMNVTLDPELLYYPCITLTAGQSVQFNMGTESFIYAIPDTVPIRVPALEFSNIVKWLCEVSVTSLKARFNNSNEWTHQQKTIYNGLMAEVCSLLDPAFTNSYCVTKFIYPALLELAKIHQDCVNKWFDVMWTHTSKKGMKGMLEILCKRLISKYRQLSNTFECTQQHEVLYLVYHILTNEQCRKHLIKNVIFKNSFLFTLMQPDMIDVVERSDIEIQWQGTKIYYYNYDKFFSQIEQSVLKLDTMRNQVLVLLLTNENVDDQVSSRKLFLAKLRDVLFKELKKKKQEKPISISDVETHWLIVQLCFALKKLWKRERPTAPILCSPDYFTNVFLGSRRIERVGGSEVEHPLIRDSLSLDLSVLEQVHENNPDLVPTDSSSFILSANVPNEDLLSKLLENIVVLYSLSGCDFLKEIRRFLIEFSVFEENLADARKMLKKGKKKLNYDPSVDYSTLESEVLSKKKLVSILNATVLYNENMKVFWSFADWLITTIEAQEADEEKLRHLPMYFFESLRDCLSVIISYIGDDDLFKFNTHSDVLERALRTMLKLHGDPRIGLPQCVSTPLDIIAAYTTNHVTMKMLEDEKDETSISKFVSSLITPQDDKWAKHCWLMNKFWYRSGFGQSKSYMDEQFTIPVIPTTYSIYLGALPSEYFQRKISEELLRRDLHPSIPMRLQNIITEIHLILDKFTDKMQMFLEVLKIGFTLNEISRNSFKLCSSLFYRIVYMVRLLEMFMKCEPKIFLENYFVESESLQKNTISIVLILMNYIANEESPFYLVIKEYNVRFVPALDFFLIASACVGVLMAHFDQCLYIKAKRKSPSVCIQRVNVVLKDTIFSLDSVRKLIGSINEMGRNKIPSLMEYKHFLTGDEVRDMKLLLYILETGSGSLPPEEDIPENQICVICFDKKSNVIFVPCNHKACLTCTVQRFANQRTCFFCKQEIVTVHKLTSNEEVNHEPLDL